MLDEESTSPTTPAEAPAKAVRRRRATKATSAPIPEPSTDGSPASGAELPATFREAVLEGGASATGETAPETRDPSPDEPAPAKRARKAPAKRAPRKRVAKAAPAADDPAGGDQAGSDQAGDDPAADAPDAGFGSADDSAPEDAAVALALQAPSDAVVEAGGDDPAVADSTGAVSSGADVTVPEALVGSGEQSGPPAEVDQPAPRTRRRRAPAVLTFQAPEPDPVPTVEDEGEVDGSASADAPAAPRRRRRAGTSGALSPTALTPTLIEPAPAGPADEEPTAGPDAGADSDDDPDRPRRRRRGRRGRGPRRDEGDEPAATASEGTPDGAAAPAESAEAEPEDDDDELNADGTRRRRRRRRRTPGAAGSTEDSADEVPTVVHVREPRAPRVRGASAADEDGVRGITGSTRMAAKRARRQEGRDSGRRRPPILSEAEFLARREAVDRTMIVRQQGERTQIAVLEDGVLVEHYVTKASAQAYAGNVYLGKVQNVLPSMEAAFIDIGKGKNGVLYAGEVNYDAQLAGHGPRKIESVLRSGQDVLVQVSKDPIAHKGARLTSQVSLPGRYLVYVPEGSMTGISRKLPETERTRLKSILKKIVPDDAGVIIRTAAEGASEEELTADVRRLQAQWEVIRAKVAEGGGPVLLHAEPDLVVRVVRDVFNEDFTSMVVQGDGEWETIKGYVEFVAPDLAPRTARFEGDGDVFAAHRIDEQLAKALDRKVWLPSGGSLVIDRTEAMIVIDVNTGKYVGKGGNLEETVTRNNLEAAEEIARQLRLRDLGGIIVVDFIDMVLESNRDLVVRRLVECLGRDRTKHQVAEVTSLGLVQMTRKRVGQGLLESFSETCEACGGRGVLVHSTPVDAKPDRGERFDDRAPRDRKKAAAGPALVAAALTKGPAVEPVAQPADSLPAGSPTDADAEPATAREAGSGRGRRRRGGRGAGAAAQETAAQETAAQDAAAQETAAQETAAQETAAQETAAQETDGAPLPPALQDLADLAPDLVPELADQPAPQVAPQPAPDANPGSGAELVDPRPLDLEQTPEPDAAPEAVEVEPALEAGAEPAAPRRRRRATSRPTGPPETG